jgi:dephospho-CoA kinase
MLVLGLTGSIGMGKSTAARFFAEEGVPVHDADAAVHRLYEGEAAALIEAAFPGTTADGKVNRANLAARALGEPAAIGRLEAIVHPLVRDSEERFLVSAKARGARVVVLDIPLLLETGADRRVDAVVVVTAPLPIQRARVLGRPDMSAAKFDTILAKQLPDAEKRRRAHFLVDSSGDFDSLRAQIRGILRVAAMIRGRIHRLAHRA